LHVTMNIQDNFDNAKVFTYFNLFATSFFKCKKETLHDLCLCYEKAKQ
jgi:hypothetical protein